MSDSRWKGIERPYSTEDVRKLQGSVVVEQTLARLGAERLWTLLQEPDATAALGTMTGDQAVQAAKAGLKRSTAAAGRSPPTRTSPGKSIPIKASIRSTAYRNWSKRINNALAALDQIEIVEGRGGAHWNFLPIVADAEAGFGGPLNVFELTESDDRGRRRRRALRRSAQLRKKVRPSRRQGADPDAASRAPPHRGPPRGRRARRADDHHRAHRCQRRDADHQRRRPDRPAIHHRRTHARRLLPHARRRRCRASHAASPTRPTPICSGWKPRSRTSKKRASSPRRSTRSFPASCWRTTARRRSTGRRNSTSDRSRRSASNSTRWATSSSSSRWRASTPSTTASSNSRATSKTRGMTAYAEFQQHEFAARSRRLHRHAPSARGGDRLLRRSRAGDQRGTSLDDRAARFDRNRAVLRERSHTGEIVSA